MATFPRVGVINLDFKDVSQMAKDIEANDPLKNAIATAGKVLSDRERDILYRRALAEAQGKEVPDETTLIEAFGKGADKVAEGASWLKDKWDRLDIRSPFEETPTPTETPITETPSEKGSREMIDYKPNQSPIETDKYRTNLKAPERAEVKPNDELSFGFSQGVGQGEDKASPIIPFATGEQVPEQIGTRVDFGTSEPGLKLRSPFAMRPKEEAQEVVSPVEGEEGATKKLKAPVDQKSQMEAWSEMNRLDPERAAFDWNRIKEKEQADRELRTQVYTPKQKAIIDAKQQNRIRMGEIQGTINTLKTEVERKPWISQLNVLQSRDIELNDQLAKLGTAGYEVIGKDTPDPTKQKGGDDEDKVLIPISPNTNANDYLSFANSYNISNYKDVSATPSGTTIQAEARLKNYDISSEDAEVIAYNIEKKVQQRDAEAARVAVEKRAKKEWALEMANKQKTMAGATWSTQQERASQAYNDLKQNPGDFSYRNEALDLLLRNETGAAIAKQETLNRLVTLLPPSKAKEVMNSLGGISGFFATRLQADEQFTANLISKYIDQLDMERVMKQLNIKKGGKALPSGGTPAPVGTPASTGTTGGFTVKKRIQ